jgi:hypothetical protein
MKPNDLLVLRRKTARDTRPSSATRGVLACAAVAIACLGLPSRASGQGMGNCENFSGGTVSGWAADPNSPNVLVGIVALGPGGAGDFCLSTTDYPGSSALAAPPSFLANWNALNCCGTFCWDYEVADDSVPGSAINVFPRFTIKNSAGKGFQFVANTAVTDPDGSNSGWHHICAPIGPLGTGNVLPSNAQGSWVPLTGTVATDWPNVACSITEAIFPVDYSSAALEVSYYDNFCLQKCFTAVNKDLRNGTGLVANGVEILVQGTFTAADLNGSFNGVFSTFTIVPVGTNTKFVWTGATVNPGVLVHVGVNLKVSTFKILGVFWTFGGSAIGCAPQCNLGYGTHTAGGVVTYKNDANDCTSTTRHVGNLSWEYYSEPPTLASLVPNGIALGLRSPMYVDAPPPIAPFALAPGQEVSLTLPPPLPTARYVVMVADIGLSGTLPDGGSTADFVLVPILPAPDPCHLVFSSPFGPGSLQMDNGPCAAAANLTYLTAIALSPGVFPNGWFFGVDISLPDLINEYNLGFPFVGSLDAAGASSFFIPGGVPSGLSLWAVTAHYGPGFVNVGSRPAVTYTIP